MMPKKVLYVLGVCGAFAACNSDTFTGEDGGADSSAFDSTAPDAVGSDASDAAPVESGPSCSCDSDAGACYGTTCVYPMTTGACLVTAGQYVYWTNGQPVAGGGAVYRMNVVNKAVELVANGQQFARGIATDDGTNVYWTFGGTPGGVMRIPVSGGTPSKVADLSDPLVLAVAGHRLYAGQSNTAVYFVDLQNAGTPKLVDTGSGTPLFMRVGAAGARVYWTAQVSAAAGNIVSVPTDGGLSRIEYSPTGRLAGLIPPTSESVPMYVYVKDNEIDSLLNFPLKVTDAPNALDLSKDTASYYWSEQRDAGAIRKLLAGGPVDASATVAVESNPLCVAPLAPSIYWTALGRMVPGSAPL